MMTSERWRRATVRHRVARDNPDSSISSAGAARPRSEGGGPRPDGDRSFAALMSATANRLGGGRVWTDAPCALQRTSDILAARRCERLDIWDKLMTNGSDAPHATFGQGGDVVG